MSARPLLTDIFSLCPKGASPRHSSQYKRFVFYLFCVPLCPKRRARRGRERTTVGASNSERWHFAVSALSTIVQDVSPFDRVRHALCGINALCLPMRSWFFHSSKWKQKMLKKTGAKAWSRGRLPSIDKCIVCLSFSRFFSCHSPIARSSLRSSSSKLSSPISIFCSLSTSLSSRVEECAHRWHSVLACRASVHETMLS